jgi:hypothetical protein
MFLALNRSTMALAVGLLRGSGPKVNSEVDIVALHARDDRSEVLVALVVGLEHLFGKAGLVERLLGFVGEAFAVGGLVVEDGDVLALVEFCDVIGGD